MTSRVVLFLSVVITLVALASPVQAQPQMAFHPTYKSTVQPVRHFTRLSSGFHIVRRVAGSSDTCTGSDINPADFRCFASNGYVYDPCWPYHPSEHARAVVCPVSPFSKNLVQISVHGSLRSSTTKRSYLWGLYVSNGRHCSAATGAVDTFQGKPVDYYCARNVGLVGQPNRTHSSWGIREVIYRGGDVHAGPYLHVNRAYYAASYRTTTN